MSEMTEIQNRIRQSEAAGEAALDKFMAELIHAGASPGAQRLVQQQFRQDYRAYSIMALASMLEGEKLIATLLSQSSAACIDNLAPGSAAAEVAELFAKMAADFFSELLPQQMEMVTAMEQAWNLVGTSELLKPMLAGVLN